MPEKILVVEDEISLQETLAYNLRRQGYEVEAVGDGNAALAAARKIPPGCDPVRYHAAWHGRF